VLDFFSLQTCSHPAIGGGGSGTITVSHLIVLSLTQGWQLFAA